MIEWPYATMDVTPAQAGVQESHGRHWIPAPDQVEGRLCAGMTWSVP